MYLSLLLSGQVHLGDFNGDGRQDALCHDTKNGHKWIKLADEAGHYKTAGWQKAMGFCFGKNEQLHIGDFNGDNRADMLCHDWKTGRNQIALANQDGHFSSVNWRDNGWCSGTGRNVHIGDFNGDCRSDLLCEDKAGNKWISLAKSAPHIGLSGKNYLTFLEETVYLFPFQRTQTNSWMAADKWNLPSSLLTASFSFIDPTSPGAIQNIINIGGGIRPPSITLLYFIQRKPIFL